MRPNFAAIVGAADRVRDVVREIGSQLAQAGWTTVMSTEGLWVAIEPAMPTVALEATGLIVGQLFSSAGADALTSVAGGEAAAIASSSGRRLLQSYWGSYAAFLVDPAGPRIHIVRDPSGAIPVYHAAHNGVRLLTSDISHPELAKLLPHQVDVAFACHWLSFPHLRGGRTGLSGLAELPPGHGLTIEGSNLVVEPLWTPWDFAARTAQIVDRDAAVGLVGAATRRAVAGLAQRARPIMLELSGGLDSSIVAACLKDAAVAHESVTFIDPTSGGDERPFARAVAARASSVLHEVEIVESHDVLAIPRRRPRPGANPSLRSIDIAFGRHAQSHGATALFSGTGGDNVFCYLTTAAPVLDALSMLGPTAAVATLRDVAALCGVTVWTAARAAARKAYRRRQRPHWRRDTSFLASGVAPLTPEPHAWLDAPAGALDGKREHVEALLRIQHGFGTQDRDDAATLVYPLLTQPVVEACLRVPSWMWTDGGRNRAVARDAFAESLPAAVLHRQGKGRLDSLCLRTYLARRADLKPLLLDGYLAADGIIDRSAVESYLASAAVPRDDLYYRIFDLATLELWLRSWA